MISLLFLLIGRILNIGDKIGSEIQWKNKKTEWELPKQMEIVKMLREVVDSYGQRISYKR